MTVKGSLNLRQLPKMLFHSIQTQNLNLISTPELKCFGSRRTKLQQQSSQQEELERQRVEIADLQQVSFCPSCYMKSVIICIQYFLFAHVCMAIMNSTSHPCGAKPTWWGRERCISGQLTGFLQMMSKVQVIFIMTNLSL